jgi:hypothetical protein
VGRSGINKWELLERAEAVVEAAVVGAAEEVAVAAALGASSQGLVAPETKVAEVLEEKTGVHPAVPVPNSVDEARPKKQAGL